ncbi:hypothetical protein PMAYCL1PPCAC_30786 [Pristionchus mayeri]|uniref:Uncharacterized protein n=1 Tax=Pristionchus mayeri TaxID=1317129 RepID=A0AAN5DBU2_9BILA|nr:hypothetical protein PMAYCL1PPCAC_30786 [Pristionchus mayeri]
MWNEEGQPPLMAGGHHYPPANGYSTAPPQMHAAYMNRGGISTGPTPLMATAQSGAVPPQMGGYWGDPSQMVTAPPPTMGTQQQQRQYGNRHQQQQQQYGGWEQQQSSNYQQQAQWQQAHPQNAQWNPQSMGMMSTPPPVMGGRQQMMGQQMNGGATGYWNEQAAYNMMGDVGHSQQHHSHHHQQHQQHQQQYSQQMGGNSRNNWQNEQQQNWNGSQAAYGQWDNKQHSSSGGGSEWGGERERTNGRRREQQWMNGGGHDAHDERMSKRFEGSVGSWNPNETPEEIPSNDMVWRDPNPKQKKPPARDIGTAIWGDPNQQRTVNLWTRPENAPSDFNWETALGPNPSMLSSGLGWDDPIPSDRASRASDIQKNITSADSAADLAHVSNQIATAVDKGILPVAVLTRDLPPPAMAELHELLHCMTRIEHLQLERARAVANHGQTGIKSEAQSAMMANIDLSIHQAKNEMERLRANICREETESAAATSKLNQWRKKETSIDQLLKATNNMAINDTRGVSDWLESSPAPHDAVDLLDDEGIDGPKEFVPGKQWKWNDPNMIAQDPNITPGQVKQSPLVAVKTGDDIRPVAPVDPTPHEAGFWIVFHHNGHMQHIYPVCADIGRVVYFKIIDHQLYIKFAAEVDAKLASSVLAREFPAIAPSMRFISDNEMTAETTVYFDGFDRLRTENQTA